MEEEDGGGRWKENMWKVVKRCYQKMRGKKKRECICIFDKKKKKERRDLLHIYFKCEAKDGGWKTQQSNKVEKERKG